MKNANIIFMGSPGFAVPGLEAILNSGYDVPFVVTVPDKPAGRGLTVNESAVKKYASARGLPVLQPEKLSDPAFIERLSSVNDMLLVVIAFRYLPEIVWKIPAYGTINLHASLLPQYRGAAPINWAIINGETRTGLTTFFIDKEIDKGKIIGSAETTIGPDETFGELYERLRHLGTGLLLDTVKSVLAGNLNPKSQDESVEEGIILHKAPKIYRELGHIDWNNNVFNIHNLIRGLSPFPGAYTNLINPSGDILPVKIYRSKPEISDSAGQPGSVLRTSNGFAVACSGGLLYPLEIQPSGKKIMPVDQFVNGYRITNDWKGY